jgi:cytochrome c-type protein NapB
MMKENNHQNHKIRHAKPGRLFLVFVGVCMVALPLIVLSALSFEPEFQATAIIQAPAQPVDHQAQSLFAAFSQTTSDYMDGTSSDRTLNEYYARRQYAGSPPFIPHTVTARDDKGCITCHAKGGWAKEFKRFTPITPHPEKAACRQCHVKPLTEDLFVENSWQTVAPPLLGRSHLPGGPPPVPHAIQMRENCIACHVGPGAVTPIRVEHPMRGNCRQCHVPEILTGLFQRDAYPSGSHNTPSNK